MIAFIEHLDDGIGQVMEALDNQGLKDETMVIFTSDNGGRVDLGSSSGDLRGAKQDMYEGGIKVPMAVIWPGEVPAGTTCDRRAMTMDIFPTVTELAGVSKNVPIDGVSLIPELLDQEDRKDQRDLVWVRREGGMKYQGQDYYALRRDDWKLLQNTPFEPFKLYNLKEDHREQHNVAEENPEIYRELLESLKQHVQRAGQVPWQKP